MDKREASREELDELLSFAETLVIKDEEEAQEKETVESARESYPMISAYMETDTVDDYPGIDDPSKLPEARKERIENYEEKNEYYIELNEKYGVPYHEARIKNDFGVLDYSNYILTNDKSTMFLEYYYQSLEYFMRRMYTKAFKDYELYRNFVRFFVVFMAIQRYISGTLENIGNVDLFDYYSIRNMFVSYGLDFFERLPVKYQRRILKNVNGLVQVKGTDQAVIDILDMFGFENIDVFKYYLGKEYDTDQDGRVDYSNASLKFYRAPQGSKNLQEHLEDMESFSYEEFVENDPYWQVDEEELLQSSFNFINTKYISINSGMNLMRETMDMSYFLNTLWQVVNIYQRTKNNQPFVVDFPDDDSEHPWIDITDSKILSGSERVISDEEIPSTYLEGRDFEMDYDDGSIKPKLPEEDGRMEDGDYLISYDYEVDEVQNEMAFNAFDISEEPIRLTDAMVALFVLVIKNMDMKDKIVKDSIGVKNVFGYEFDHTEDVSYQVSGQERILTTEEMEFLMEENSDVAQNHPDEFDDLISEDAFMAELFVENKEFREDLEAAIVSTFEDIGEHGVNATTSLPDIHERYDLYRKLKKLWDVKFITDNQREVFGDYETYSDWLYDRNRDLFEFSYIEDENDDIEDQKYQRRIVELSTSIDNYLDSDEFDGLLSNSLLASDFIKDYLYQLINIFKSYTTEIKDFTVSYVFNSKLYNTVKFFERFDDMDAEFELEEDIGDIDSPAYLRELKDVAYRYAHLLREDPELAEYFDDEFIKGAAEFELLMGVMDYVGGTPYFHGEDMGVEGGLTELRDSKQINKEGTSTEVDGVSLSEDQRFEVNYEEE